MGDYEQTPANTIHRYAPRGIYNADFIHKLFNTTPILHVSFPAPDHSTAPAILPMIGCVTTWREDGEPHLYLHGHAQTRMAVLAANGALPVSAAATKVDGLVLSLSPFSHSMNYRSGVILGSAGIVSDADEKLWALEQISEKVMPARWDNTRVPPTKAELTTTSVLKVRIESASAKTREGGPGEEKRDMKSEEVLDRVWTGVVPMVERYEEPIRTDYCRGTMPSYIQEFVDERNEEATSYAIRVAKEEYGKKG